MFPDRFPVDWSTDLSGPPGPAAARRPVLHARSGTFSGGAEQAELTSAMAAAVLFGLSMDYEVFLLSRIREEYLATHDNTESIVAGIANTARVITPPL